MRWDKRDNPSLRGPTAMRLVQPTDPSSGQQNATELIKRKGSAHWDQYERRYVENLRQRFTPSVAKPREPWEVQRPRGNECGF